MENKNMNRMQMIKEKINSFPAGSISQSNHYWCVTCKKFFVLDKPECPYMTGMCVNTPIAVENLAPESTESIEKFGLFYPKIPQRLLNAAIQADYKSTGAKLVDEYFSFLNDWNFTISQQQPLQTIKSFIIVLSGCETAQRVNEDSVTFVLMDAGKIWEKAKIREILAGSLERFKEILSINQDLNIDFIDILGEREVGKYYCAKCGMFFEFGMKRDKVTCPLMAQKCMFDPQHIENVEYSSEKLLKQFEITPDIYKRFINIADSKTKASELFSELISEWNISENQEAMLKFLV